MRNLKSMKNEKAVSPVIGVILMVVITVIIAAVLAVFAFGLESPKNAPQASLRFTAISAATTGGNDEFTIAHEGGESLILNNEQITVYDAVAPATVIYNGVLIGGLATAPATGTLAPGTSFTDIPGTGLTKGQILIVQVLDVPTGQLIVNTKVTVS